ncbi:hypothetical protein R3W88_000911 [Solanum pinnatisectum]|uniref:Uncharacterized protein n=1 Tax=Solanum pinnatisectum TaxID=50273 RepID=A0AAV9MH20_9SOLN|nr:hypothetical protein R3W88_000911 [Solanum pinnatisectum]
MLKKKKKSEVNILDLKEKLHLFSKRKLIDLRRGLISDFQELTCERDHMFKDFTEQKYKCMELNSCKITTDEETNTPKKQIDKLGLLNLNLKSEILKLFISEKEKCVMSDSEKRLEGELKELKMNLEKANRWTHLSRIVNHLSERNHNVKVGIRFLKESEYNRLMLYLW